MTTRDTVLPRESVTPSGVAQSQPTPEEIAEGLSEYERAQLMTVAGFTARHGFSCGFGVNEGQKTACDDMWNAGLLIRDGSNAWRLTDLGRAVADVLAKRGAR